jgi:streptogramin lyase
MRHCVALRRPTLACTAALLLGLGSSCGSSTGVAPPTRPAGEVYATLPMTGRPFAAAVAFDGTVYVSQVDGGSVARTDLSGATVNDVIPVGIHPSQVRVGPSGKVYVGN